MWGILFIFINLAITAVIAIYPGRALFNWIYSLLQRLAYRGLCITEESLPIPNALLFPAIGAVIYEFANFVDTCDPGTWVSNLLGVALWALGWSLGYFVLALLILYIILSFILKIFGPAAEKYEKVRQTLFDGYSYAHSPRDAIRESENFMKEHKLTTLMLMKEIDDDDD